MLLEVLKSQRSVCAAVGTQELGRVLLACLYLSPGQYFPNLCVYQDRLEGRFNRLLTPPLNFWA